MKLPFSLRELLGMPAARVGPEDFFQSIEIHFPEKRKKTDASEVRLHGIVTH